MQLQSVCHDTLPWLICFSLRGERAVKKLLVAFAALLICTRILSADPSQVKIPSPGKALAVYAPRPQIPAEARLKHCTDRVSLSSTSEEMARFRGSRYFSRPATRFWIKRVFKPSRKGASPVEQEPSRFP